MPRSFLIKKHSKITGVVNADDTVLSSERHHPQLSYDYERYHNHHSHHMTERESLVKPEIKLPSSCSPTSVIVSSRNGGLSSYPTRISPYHDNRVMQDDNLKMKKTFAELPVDNNYDDKAYDLSIKRSPSPSSISPSSRRDEEINSKRGVNLHQHHRVSVVTGPSPPPTPPLSSEKSMTPPPGVAMISPIKSQLSGGNLLLKAELEAPPSWHRPHPFPPYLPFGFPLYSSFPGHRAVPGHPVSYPGSLSPNSEHHQPQHYTVPPKYFPATSTSHLMPLSPPRSLGSNSNNPTIVRPEAHHPNILPNNNHSISPRVPSPNAYYPNQGHYLPQRHLNVQYNEIVTPAFCSTTPPWSSSEEKTQTSPCPSSDSDSGRENSMVTSSLPDSKQRRKGANFAPVNGNTESPRYQCSDCNKNYSTYSGLSKHRQFHCALTQTKKSFSCKYCEKVYVSLGALKMHIRTHTLPCKCKLCGKAFSRPWLLQGHIRTHTGEKPFACQHCSRAFADRSNLRAHLQTHSDVKKYSCKACSKTFSRMSLLLKHEDGGCVAVQR